MKITRANVIVVGAGPAGTSTAYALAAAGVKVVIIEEHRKIGAPCHCAGLVSPRTLELAGLDSHVHALRTYCRARVWGPQGSQALLDSDRVQAVAIDRPALDRHLAGRAQRAGAQLWTGVRAQEFERLDGEVRVTASNGKRTHYLQAPIIIGADGMRSRVARWLNGHEKTAVVPAIKADVRFSAGSPQDIEIFVGNELAPGWFAWVIPLDEGEARLGLGGFSTDIKPRFERFLGRIRRQFGQFEILSQRVWLIPAEPRREIAFDNGMLVGDAARQAKPSSGGGIFMSLRAGELAAQTALHGLNGAGPSRSALEEYQRLWLDQEGEELRYNHWLRAIYNQLNDDEIDRLVALCNSAWAQAIIRRLGDIDFTSGLFRPIHLALGRVAPRLLLRLGERLRQTPSESIAEDLEALRLAPDDLLENLET